MPMLQVLEASSENVFVPITVGGGIREYTDPITNAHWSALDVTTKYFQSGADKVSIGSDAVFAAETYLEMNKKTGESSIEQISSHYGAQAVVVSIDPKRVYCDGPSAIVGKETLNDKTIVQLRDKDVKGPNGECFCWWQVTVKGNKQGIFELFVYLSSPPSHHKYPNNHIPVPCLILVHHLLRKEEEKLGIWMQSNWPKYLKF